MGSGDRGQRRGVHEVGPEGSAIQAVAGQDGQRDGLPERRRDPALVEERVALAQDDDYPYIEWDTCPFDAPSGTVEGETYECGYLYVLENRTDPDSYEIELPFVIIYSDSANPQPDPIIYLEGGPGGSAIAAPPSAASWLPPLKPNQPTQSMAAPVMVMPGEWGGVISRGKPLRPPSSMARTRAMIVAVFPVPTASACTAPRSRSW